MTKQKWKLEQSETLIFFNDTEEQEEYIEPLKAGEHYGKKLVIFDD